MPTEEDVLHAYMRELDFLYDGVLMQVYDVGGQTNERKKCIHSFENVRAVVCDFIIILR